ncbi:galactose-specific lectin nattectin-like [Epinephelus lanceolatus]
MTWPQAQSYCRANYTDLASVRDREENHMVQLLIPANQSAWIGLFRDGWKWSDGSSSLFTNWRDTRPRGSATCVVADFTMAGKWINWRCDSKRGFICHSKSKPTKQATKKQVFRLKFTNNDPSLDLNNPAVAEGILKQLKQKLKDKELGDNIKLSWKKQPDGKVFHKKEKKRKIRKDEL